MKKIKVVKFIDIISLILLIVPIGFLLSNLVKLALYSIIGLAFLWFVSRNAFIIFHGVNSNRRERRSFESFRKETVYGTRLERLLKKAESSKGYDFLQLKEIELNKFKKLDIEHTINQMSQRLDENPSYRNLIKKLGEILSNQRLLDKIRVVPTSAFNVVSDNPKRLVYGYALFLEGDRLVEKAVKNGKPYLKEK